MNNKFGAMVNLICAAHRRDAQAQYMLAKQMWNGQEKRYLCLDKDKMPVYETAPGIKKDTGKAFKLFNESAWQGNKDAQFMLGTIAQQNGKLGHAVFWYKKAAKQNHPDAINNLGMMYFKGQGLPKDYKKAQDYLDRAVKLGGGPVGARVLNNTVVSGFFY